MARSKLKRKPAPEQAALVLPYGADDSGKPARATAGHMWRAMIDATLVEGG